MNARLVGLAGLALLAALQAARCAPVEVHPAGASVPENLLRIELRFARPPPLPFDVGRLTLLDAASGTPIEDALLDLALPDATGRRLTILLDPGRVKQGVGPNVEAGRALHAGQSVQLLMADGSQQPPRLLKSWQVVPAVQVPLPLSSWRLSAPHAGSREPLIVDLGTAISAAGEGLIAVVDPSGRRIEGSTALDHDDSVWRFVPHRPWGGGVHRLVVSPQLEDPAGNRPCAAFEANGLSSARCEAPAGLAFTPREH